MGAAVLALLPLLSLSGPEAKAEPLVAPKAEMLAPVRLGPAEGGMDRMHYIDAGLRPFPTADESSYQDNPLVQTMLRAQQRYAAEWAELPQTQIPHGPTLKLGATGRRVAALQTRLGLSATGRFDSDLARAIERYRLVHELPRASHADRQLVTSLNSGFTHYAQLIARNLDRAREIPQDLPAKFVWVDIAAQQLSMFEEGLVADRMRVIVGKPSMQTPSLAAYIRHAEVHPVWNIPPDLVRKTIAPRAAQRGHDYVTRAGYDVLSDFTGDATRLSPEEIDWTAIAQGARDVRVVQKPGPANAMGDVKFMFPNHLGIYLHDTPQTGLFSKSQRMFSAGCVRLEDADRLARWLFQSDIFARANGMSAEITLPDPIPVFTTYFTFWPDEDGSMFRTDIYGRDKSDPHRWVARPAASV